MGTTWLFNVLRRMAEVDSSPLGVVADGTTPPSGAWAGPVLIKSHRADSPDLLKKFDSSLALHGLVMMRDPEPTLASLLRTQTADRSELLGWLETDVASYRSALPVMSRGVVIREEWVADRATAIITHIALLTGMNLTTEQCSSIAAEVDRENVRKQVATLEEKGSWKGEFTKYDSTTQWHAGHIGPATSAAVDLTTEERQRVVSLRNSIDELTATYALWDRQPLPLPPTSLRTMTFIEERSRALASATPQPGLITRVVDRIRASRAAKG